MKLIDQLTPTEIAELFGEKRRTLGLTPRQLARRWKMSERTIRRWEAGEFNCHPIYLERLDKMLDEQHEADH